MSYRCTECDQTHATFAAAAGCHPGIGGVEDLTTAPCIHDREG